MKSFDESVEFEELYKSMWKCKRDGKIRKASVARFVTHGIEESIKLENEIQSGKYKPRKPRTFTLTYPKVRPCSSTHIRDRIVQRSLNDNTIYPAMTRGFICDNMACQKGKGTTKAMDRIDQLLHRYFINNGDNKGWVLQFDVQGYYRNMRHTDAEQTFLRRLDKKTVDNAMIWLQRQYPYDKGFEPGSQMIQILGISMLDKMDHAVKEKMRAKYYIRYMDDGLIISDNKLFLENCKSCIEKELSKLGMNLHPKKTKIYRLTDGIKILGFTFRLTDTGKVIRILDPRNVKHERKKLRRMANLMKKGKLPMKNFLAGYEAWKAHARLGNSYKLLQRMDQYAISLLKEVRNESESTDINSASETGIRPSDGENRGNESHTGLQHYDGES